MNTALNTASFEETAVLDQAHVGDIRGALGTIVLGDVGPRRRLSAKAKAKV